MLYNISQMSACESPHHENPEESPGSELLKVVRQRIIAAMFDQFNVASFAELTTGKRLIRPAPLAVIGNPKVLSILLTEDGVKPYKNQLKERFVLFLSPEDKAEIGWFNHTSKLGNLEKFTIIPEILTPREDEMITGYDGEYEGEFAHPSEIASFVTPSREFSQYERLTILEEKIQRYLPTPQ